MVRVIQVLIVLGACLVALANRQLPSKLRVRGGTHGNSPYELNPDYMSSPKPVRLGDSDGDFPPPSSFYIETQTFSLGENSSQSSGAKGLVPALAHYASNLHRTSPTLSLSSLASLSVFALWNIVPKARPILQKYFVCSRLNLRAGRWPGLVLSSVSHIGFWHICFNMMALLSVGPKVRQVLLATCGWPLYPLVLGSALAGSAVFLALDRRQAGGMGLSAVTLSLIAVYSRFFPNRQLGILLAGIIPVRLAARQWLGVMLAWSVVGSLADVGGVAHSAHLGGLLFGLAYYEVWLRRLPVAMRLRRLGLWRLPIWRKK